MQKNSSPLIELHGFSKTEAGKQIRTIRQNVKEGISPRDFDSLIFSIVSDVVTDMKGKARPFIRFYSREYAIVHKIIEILKDVGWKGEVEFICITNYFDLRE